jgi:hypothetical protein
LFEEAPARKDPIRRHIQLCAFAPLREMGFLIQAAVLAKAPKKRLDFTV